MRAGSLSQEPAFNYIRNHFVCGYRNIYKERYAGNSSAHPMNAGAVTTTNGAGPHNVQIFVLSEDGTVLHCMPGYWNPQDLVSELSLAEKLNTLWQDGSMSPADKSANYKKLQLEHIAMHSKETTERSHLQGFDAMYIAHHAKELPDLIEKPDALADYQRDNAHAMASATGTGEKAAHVGLPPSALKTTDKIMHERMSKTPFVAYSKFDVASFTNYGTQFYDKNENEIEGKFAHADWKKMDLKKVTHEAENAADATQTSDKGRVGMPSQRGTKGHEVAIAKSPHEILVDRFKSATDQLRSQPHNVSALENRADAEFNLRMYKQAFSDASWAAYYGSRSAANARIKQLAGLANDSAATTTTANVEASANTAPVHVEQAVSAKRLISAAPHGQVSR